jgi:hypothetical protein
LDVATGSIDQSGSYVFAVAAVAATTSVGELLPAWSLQGGNDSMFTFWNSGGQQQDVTLMLNPADGSSPYELPIHLAAGSTVNVDLAEIRSSGEPDPEGHSFPMALFGSAMLMPAGIPKPAPNGLITVPASGFWNMKDVILSAAVFDPSTGTCGNYCGNCCGYSCPEVIADNESEYVAVGSTFSAYMTVEDVSGFSENCTSTADWGANLFTYNGIVADEAQFTVTGSGTDYVQGDLWDAAVPPVDNYCPCGCPTDDIFGTSPNITSSPADQCGDATNPASLSRAALIQEYVTDGVAWTPGCSDFTNSASSTNFSFYQFAPTDQYQWALLPQYYRDNAQATYNLVGTLSNGSHLAINSGYRNPEKERSVDLQFGEPFHPNSRHVYGDGADFATPGGQTDFLDIEQVVWNDNIDGNIACVEPYSSGDAHAHVQWNLDAAAHNRSAVCPTTSAGFWGKP